MPPLRNARHEAFARALFEGETADEAYVKAGYSENRGNASRLKAKESILNRDGIFAKNILVFEYDNLFMVAWLVWRAA